MSDSRRSLTEQLIAVLQEHIAGGGEAALLRAYELGRSAVTDRLNVLEMLAMQQEVLVTMLLQRLGTDEGARLTQAAADVFAESLAPFELARRSSQEGTALLRHLNEELERQVAERTDELQRQRDFAESLIETARAIVLVLDLDGRIVRFNQYMEELSGYRLAEVQGKSWFATFIPERAQSRVQKMFAEALQGPQTYHALSPMITCDGHQREIEWSSTTLKDRTGNLIGLLSIGQDISEKVRLQEQLLERERLAAIGTTAATFAHEVGNPLNSMYMSVQLLERRLPKQHGEIDERALVSLRNLMSEMKRLISLLEEFRTLARRQKLNLRPLSLAAVVADVLAVESLSYLARGITVEQSFPRDLPPVWIDAEKVKQVVLNLCKNAVEAMPEGGQLTVSATSSGRQVCLTIKDTGVGIPAGIDIFEPFTTTKSKGTGLGLTIVRQIIAAHNGTLTYQSTPGQGTTFTLALPVAAS